MKAESHSRYEVSVAGTLADAKQRLQKESFDLMLLDFNLPDSRGLATLQSLKESASSLAIIVVTGMDARVANSMSSGEAFDEMMPPPA